MEKHGKLSEYWKCGIYCYQEGSYVDKTGLIAFINHTLDITLFISRGENIKDIVKRINDEVMEEVAEIFGEEIRGTDLAETLIRAAKSSGKKFIMIIDE